MKRLALFTLLLLTACQDQTAQTITPVALTAETTGYYCQMNLTEHPGPKGQIHLDGLPGAPLFFSQVRDAIAYLRLPERDHRILAIYVSDMGAAGATWDDPGPTNWIPAEQAFYVMGSSRNGGMGAPELIPFADPAKAQAFATRYGGRILPLSDIPDDAVIAPDDPTVADAAAEDPDYDARLRALSKHSHKGG